MARRSTYSIVTGTDGRLTKTQQPRSGKIWTAGGHLRAAVRGRRDIGAQVLEVAVLGVTRTMAQRIAPCNASSNESFGSDIHFAHLATPR